MSRAQCTSEKWCRHRSLLRTVCFDSYTDCFSSARAAHRPSHLPPPFSACVSLLPNLPFAVESAYVLRGYVYIFFLVRINWHTKSDWKSPCSRRASNGVRWAAADKTTRKRQVEIRRKSDHYHFPSSPISWNIGTTEMHGFSWTWAIERVSERVGKKLSRAHCNFYNNVRMERSAHREAERNAPVNKSPAAATKVTIEKI